MERDIGPLAWSHSLRFEHQQNKLFCCRDLFHVYLAGFGQDHRASFLVYMLDQVFWWEQRGFSYRRQTPLGALGSNVPHQLAHKQFQPTSVELHGSNNHVSYRNLEQSIRYSQDLGVQFVHV